MDDEDQSQKKRVLTGVRWTGKSVRTKNSRTYYTEATLKLGPREKKVVPGQYLQITPDEEENQSMPHYGRFPFPDRENIEIRGPGICYLCDKLKEDMENRNETIVGEDGRSVRIQGSWYSVGPFLMIRDSPISFKIHAKIPKSYPKPKVDSKLHPEDWRKPSIFKPDQPFQVVRLEKVIQKSRQDFCILLHLCYRPEDTHLSHEEARFKPYSLLHWSEEKVLMYPKEVAAVKHKFGLERVSIDKVVGKCYVKPMENMSEEDDLIKWTDAGEDRFFIDLTYDADRETFEPLHTKVIKALKQALDLWPAPVLEPVSALNTMDIFAGCGGLSTGLGQAGAGLMFLPAKIKKDQPVV